MSAEDLVNGWKINHYCSYIALILVIPLVVRIVSSFFRVCEFRAIEKKRFGLNETFCKQLWNSFLGCPLDRWKPESGDYWHPFILGILETASYPILIITGFWQAIGAWLTFKTLGQWKHWADHRASFNRFLIGNALIIIMSFLIVKCDCDIVTKQEENAVTKSKVEISIHSQGPVDVTVQKEERSHNETHRK